MKKNNLYKSNLNSIYLSSVEVQTLSRLLNNYQDSMNNYSKKVTQTPEFKALMNDITTIQIKLSRYEN